MDGSGEQSKTDCPDYASMPQVWQGDKAGAQVLPYLRTGRARLQTGSGV